MHPIRLARNGRKACGPVVAAAPLLSFQFPLILAKWMPGKRLSSPDGFHGGDRGSLHRKVNTIEHQILFPSAVGGGLTLTRCQ